MKRAYACLRAMTAAPFPSAERSGAHRIAHTEVGDVREVIATIAGFATMARAQSVGPRALRDMLPELQHAAESADPAVMRAVVAACEVLGLSTGLVTEAGLAAERLLEATRTATEPLRLAIEAAAGAASGPRSTVSPRTLGGRPSAGLGAKARITLQSACQDAVEHLLEVRSAAELLLRASTCEPLPIALEDLISELSAGELGGSEEIVLESRVDPALLVAVAPKVAVPLLQRVLSLALASGVEGHFELVSREEAGRVRLELGLRPGGRSSRAGRRSGQRFLIPRARAYDAPVVALAAGALAATVNLHGSSAEVSFLSQAP